MVVAFDLDDTLYQEIEYVRSAYRAISRKFGAHYLPAMMSAATPAEAFDITGLDIAEELDIYRTHIPDIKLPWDSLYTLAMLRNLGHVLALITDGREVTQKHKVEALGLYRYMAQDMIYISESFGEGKMTGGAMRDIMAKYPSEKYLYIGDNPEKDFIRGNELGWLTVALKAKKDNIFVQKFDEVDSGWLPAFVIDNIIELIQIVNRIG
ncbi:MAG: HAD-IA family hydrolase [Duncaniella sp.]|nr:HAD-IA family hydrolase [Duncaniella sp.]